MKRKSKKQLMVEDRLGCYGDFNLEHMICKKYCALRLLCTIERDYIEKMNILEDLASEAEMMFSVQ